MILGVITTDRVTVFRGKMEQVLLMTTPLSDNTVGFFFFLVDMTRISALTWVTDMAILTNTIDTAPLYMTEKKPS
jgi:hypothetical protein